MCSALLWEHRLAYVSLSSRKPQVLLRSLDIFTHSHTHARTHTYKSFEKLSPFSRVHRSQRVSECMHLHEGKHSFASQVSEPSIHLLFLTWKAYLETEKTMRVLCEDWRTPNCKYWNICFISWIKTHKLQFVSKRIDWTLKKYWFLKWLGSEL